MDRKRLFVLGLRNIFAEMVAVLEDWLDTPYDHSILARRRDKARKMAAITLR